MTTTIDRFRKSGSSRRGFTLAEVLVAVALSGVILAASTGSLLFLAKSSNGLGNYQEMNMRSRFALEEFGSDARMTEEVTAVSATSVTLVVYTAGGGTANVVYSYDSVAGTFTRTEGGVSRVMLEDIESLAMTCFQFDRVTETTNPLEVKQIQLEVVMQRETLAIANTNEIISARFMMRNRSVNT